MDKLLDGGKFKLCHRKAIMLCHPDKLGNNPSDDPDKFYIANRCFAAITEAYNTFKVRRLVVQYYRLKRALIELVICVKMICNKVNLAKFVSKLEDIILRRDHYYI